MESSEKTAWLSILTNLLLVGIKTGVVIITGSLAVTADAIHSLTDVISSAIVLLGIKISRRSARGFPYGLYKVENLVALVTSVLILFAGYEIIKAVFINPNIVLPRNIPVAIAGVSLTIVITWLFASYELKKGRETGSPSLIADARHIWTDMLSSIVILGSLVGCATGFAADKYAAVIVVIFIARSALSICLDSVRVLLDASLDYNSLNRIREIVLSDQRVAEIQNIWARNAGRYKFIELDLVLRLKDLETGHRLSEEIENRVKMEIEQVDRVLIHFQPRQRQHITVGIPLAENKLNISAHFGEAPYFRFLGLQRREGEVVEDKTLKNPFINEEKAKGIKVAKWLLDNELDILISFNDQSGKGPGFVLGNAGAEILLTREITAEKALEVFLGELRNPLQNEAMF
jgi:cation diffusion facilitator family transporter